MVVVTVLGVMRVNVVRGVIGVVLKMGAVMVLVMVREVGIVMRNVRMVVIDVITDEACGRVVVGGWKVKEVIMGAVVVENDVQ